MLQLNPPLPLITPRGKGMAVLVNDRGTENHLEWTVLQDDGEVWTWRNTDVRAQENITGRPPAPGMAGWPRTTPGRWARRGARRARR